MNTAECLSLTPGDVGWPMANMKGIQKKCLEFENNAIGHTTFTGLPTLLAGLTIHV